MSKTVLVGIAALAATAVAVPVAGASVEPSVPAWCAAGVELRAESLPTRLPATPGCDLVGRRIHKGDLSLEVPPRGTTVGLSSTDTDGARDFSVASYLDGTVGIDDFVTTAPATHDPLDDPLGVVRPVPDPCSTAAANEYSLWGHRVAPGLNWLGWLYNAANDPVDGRRKIEDAGNAMASGHNDCGITTVPNAPSTLNNGTTTLNPQNGAGTCPATNDNSSVIGWKSVGPETLANVCRWVNNTFSPPRLVNFDMAINPDFDWTTTLGTDFTTSDIKACGGPEVVEDVSLAVRRIYDLEAVVTHEFGHVYGLLHTAEPGPGSTQTMAPTTAACDANARTLGRGDVNGLIAVYGAL